MEVSTQPTPSSGSASGRRSASASVVIPAHDEEAVIGRCLERLLDGAGEGDLEVVVVANGCSDATVAIAQRFEPRVRVVEIDVASKVAALNAGDAAVTAFPRIYLDADIELGLDAVRAVARLLEGGTVHCAAPRARVDLDGRPAYIRAFYRALTSLPYFTESLVGNGVYALSAEGRGRFGAFPDITADDLFVRNVFPDHERGVADDASFTIHPPRNLAGLLAVRERVYRGNEEYARAGYVSSGGSTFSPRRLARLLLRDPGAALSFVGVNLLAKVRLRTRGARGGWERDDSSRSPLRS